MTHIYYVSHPWLLHLDHKDGLDIQNKGPLEVTGTLPDGVNEFVIDRILDCRINRRNKDTLTNKMGLLQYKVAYVNSDDWNASPTGNRTPTL